MKLTKVMIEELVTEIEEFLRKNELLSDVCIYFNNKRRHWYTKWYSEDMEVVCEELEDISPLDYFEYANPKHILSMSFEGSFYDVMNGWSSRDFKLQEKFQKILDKYSVYYELGSSWNLSCFPSKDDMEIEFTDYRADVKPDPEYIYLGKQGIPVEILDIMEHWYELSKATGDVGGCVIGAGMNFTYKGKPYKMAACSPWQGELSWTPHVGKVKKMLADIGATEISWNCGRLD